MRPLRGPHPTLAHLGPPGPPPPLQVNNDVTLSAAHNLNNNALKAGITYNTKVTLAAGLLSERGARAGMGWAHARATRPSPQPGGLA